MGRRRKQEFMLPFSENREDMGTLLNEISASLFTYLGVFYSYMHGFIVIHFDMLSLNLILLNILFKLFII